MVFPANWRRYVPVRPEEHMTPPIHDNEQIPRHMADLPTDGPPHPFVCGVVRVKIELGICEAVDLLAEPAIKFLVIGPDDYPRVRMHTISSWRGQRTAADPSGLRGPMDQLNAHSVFARALSRCLQPLRSFFPCWHRVNCIIERPRIADIKNARRFPTPQGVWHIPRQANVGVAAERRHSAIGRDIGKVSLDPDIEFVTRMAMVGKCIMGGKID